jgi:hypothetical protein
MDKSASVGGSAIPRRSTSLAANERSSYELLAICIVFHRCAMHGVRFFSISREAGCY